MQEGGDDDLDDELFFDGGVAYHHALALAARLEDRNKGVRRAAVHALRAMPPEGQTQVVCVVAIRLEHADMCTRTAVVSALGAMSPALMEHGGANVCLAAVAALGAAIAPAVRHAGKVGGPVAAHLEDAWAQATSALGALSPKVQARVAASVAALLEHGDVNVRLGAVWALGSMVAPAVQAQHVPAVAARLEDGDGGVRGATTRALKAMALRGHVQVQHVAMVAALLEHGDADVRWSAGSALVTIAPTFELRRLPLAARVLLLGDQSSGWGEPVRLHVRAEAPVQSMLAQLGDLTPEELRRKDVRFEFDGQPGSGPGFRQCRQVD